MRTDERALEEKGRSYSSRAFFFSSRKGKEDGAAK
jgi:hypothetical protein